MHLRASLPLLALGLLVAAPPAAAQRSRRKSKPPKTVQYYDGKLADARAEAAGRNVPVLVLCILEGEEANVRFYNEILDNRPLAAATRDMIVVLVNDGRHEQTEIKVKGPDGKTIKKSVCKDYQTETCDVHRRNWDAVYQELVMDSGTQGRWDLPQAMILLPNFELLLRIYNTATNYDFPSESEMIKALKSARVKAGPGITVEAFHEARRLAEEGRIMGSAKVWAASWSAWTGVLAITHHGALAEEAESGSDAALEQLRLVLAETCQRLVPSENGEASRAYRKLVELSRELGDSPLDAELRYAIKRAERDPLLKAEVALTKLEIEGEGLLDQVHALLAEGEKKKAKRVLKKLLGKRFQGTRVAERGRELLGDD